MDRIRGLDGLRALACLLVIAHHVIPRLPQPESQLTKLIQMFGNLAQTGVSIFFVLSGFLLSLPFWWALYEGRPLPSLRNYLVKRFARIVPGFYLAIATSFILSITVFNVSIDATLVGRLFAGMFFINSFSAETIFPTEINGPLWSIGFEVVSYLILLVFLAALTSFNMLREYKHFTIFMVLSLIMVVVLHLFWVSIVGAPTQGVGWDYGLVGFARTWVPHTNIFSMYGHFHIGVLAAAAFPLVIKRSSAMRNDLILIVSLVLISAATAAMWVLTSNPVNGLLNMKYLWPSLPVAISVALVYMPVTRFVVLIFDGRPLRFIAKISFGMYIWHMVYVDLIAKYVFTDFVYGGQMLLSNWFLATTLTMVLTAITAVLSWNFVEKPVIDWVRRNSFSTKKAVLAEVRVP